MNSATDVVFARPGGEALALDVAWVADGVPRPLVLLLHGGGWSGGVRGSLHGEMWALARLGYVAATADYRLAESPRNVFPAALDDARAALAFLRAHAATYAIDPARVAVSGVSAGGHLAALLALTAPPGAVRGAVVYAAPADLRAGGPHTAEQAGLVTNFLGVFPGDDPGRAAAASPIAQVRAGAPPFLLVHGAADTLVLPEQSRRLAAALATVGTEATLVEVAGLGHAFATIDSAAQRRVHRARTAALARWLAAAPDGSPDEAGA